MKKKQLMYSALSDTMYWVDGKGEKNNVTQNFIHMMLLYITQNDPPEVGRENIRELSVDGKVKWQITVKHVAE